MSKYIPWSVFGVMLYKTGGKYAIPTSLGVALTDKCNLPCRYCMRKTFKPEPATMTLANLRRILSKAPYVTGVCIMGLCEPYLNNETSDIIRWLKDKGGYSISLTTNLTIPFNYDMLDALRRVDDMAVSIDCADPDVFHTLRGTSLDHVMKNFHTLIEFKRRYGLTAEDKPPIHVNAVMTPLNWPDVPNLIKMFEPYANDLTYLMIDPCTRPDFSTEDTFVISEKPDSFDEFKHIAKQSPLKVIGFDWMFKKSTNWSTCSMSWLGPFIQANGDVYPCYGYTYVVGNVYKKSLLRIWNSPLMREFRHRLATNYPPLQQCHFCNFARPKWQVGGVYNKLHEDQDI